MINIKNVDSNLLKIDKKSYKNIDLYSIGYITIKRIDKYENIHSVNLLYLIIGKADRHIKSSNSVEEKIGSKYLVFDSTDENIKVLEKNTELWGFIKKEIRN